jgi:hypothetical protein
MIENWNTFNFQTTTYDYEGNQNWSSSSHLRSLILKFLKSRYKRWGLSKKKYPSPKIQNPNMLKHNTSNEHQLDSRINMWNIEMVMKGLITNDNQ